jgi:hypothetical protein
MSQTVNEPLAALARQVASAAAAPSAFEVVARETVTVRGLFGKKQKRSTSGPRSALAGNSPSIRNARQ